ncbi:MAG: anthranilate synthase component I [Actinomycetota bacterium]
MRLLPDVEEFIRLAGQHAFVPVRVELLADLETPVSAFSKLVGDDEGFVLESVEGIERWSRYSFVGRRPQARLVARGSEVEIEGSLPTSVPTDRGVLAAIEAFLGACTAPQHPDLPPLQSGLVGYLGYDVVREVERLPHVPRDDHGLPDAVLTLIGQLAAFDHWRQRVHLIESVPVGHLGGDESALRRAWSDAGERLEEAVEAMGRPLPYRPVAPPLLDDELPEVRSSMPAGAFQEAVGVAKEHILDGDIFQVVLSQRFDLDLQAAPFDFYRSLRQINPSPYMYFVRDRDVSIVGSSPEPMVQLLGDTVISRPIAGTRRRGATAEEDRRLGAELAEHPKEVAEHVMLVDLARNDVGRVVDFGTCHVEELMTLERYSHVMHLTSQVTGRLRSDRTPIDVLRATLPAGTLSGAPKVRAMEIIDALEPAKRGPYGGVVGYLDLAGNIDTAIAIRTMLIHEGGASIQAGAGIVADSDPDDENDECWNKAKALLSAVPAARRMTAEAEVAR